jgi:hypothetical protein
LRRNGSYTQAGEPADTSPYQATAPEPADLAGRPIGPAARAPSTAAPAVAKPLTAARPAKAAAKPVATTKPAATAKSTSAAKATAWPQSRPVAFVVPGARKEPLDEMPLPDRATALAKWVDAHPTMTPAAVTYWLYQNAWIVAGAKFGWWRGAGALKTLIAVDHRAQSLWGIGAKSARIAAQALSDVQARAK